MDDFKQAELLSEIDRLRQLNKEIKSENMRMKVTLDDYGIESDDLEEIPDAEIIAMHQLERLRELSDTGVQFTKEEADVFKILTKALMDIRGGTIKRQKKTPKGKDLEADDLLDQLKLIRGDKA